jgi:hypothetical protein
MSMIDASDSSGKASKGFPSSLLASVMVMSDKTMRTERAGTDRV